VTTEDRKLTAITKNADAPSVTTSVVLSSPILVSLMKKAISSSETSILTRAIGRNIPEDATLHYHLHLQSPRKHLQFKTKIMKLLFMQCSPPSGHFILFDPNITFSTIFSNILSLCPPINVRHQAPHICRTTAKIMVLYFLIFIFVDSRREDRRFLLKVSKHYKK
jgi:hypothetical protein